MKYYLWDKKSELLGISASVMLDARPDFKYDDVLVISNEKATVIIIETKSYFKEAYLIDSDDPHEVARQVIEKMDEEESTLDKKIEENLSDEDKEDTSFIDIIEDVMSKIKNDYPDEVYFVEDVTDKFMDDDYEDPYVKNIDLTDVNEDVEVKKLTVVFSHAFITEIKDLENLKFMDKYNSTKQLLIDKREKAMHEDDEISIELINKELASLYKEVDDTCDVTFKVDATSLQHYDTNMIIHCENGQTIIINNDVVESVRESAIEYEKTRDGGNGRYKVHYKTVNIELSECYNEVVERGDSVFIVEI
jgi:hypothetical protein